MKRICHLYIMLFSLTIGLVGCGDNTGFCEEHVLTQDEIAEMARQDSINEAQKNSIDADLILEYTVEDVVSASSWTSKTLEIDLDAIAELFGITTDELTAGIAGEDGAPEIKGFAIEATTHDDKSVASNTSGVWGHWWDTSGDVCDTYNQDTSAFYAEWNDEDNVFAIGQYPGHLSAGDSITVLECLKYNDLRVAVQITYIVTTEEEYQDPETAPTGNPTTVENTITLTKAYDNTYTSVEYDVKDILCNAFKMTTYEIYSAINNDSLKVYLNEETTEEPSYTADAPGYWIDANGASIAYANGIIWISLGYDRTSLYLYGGNHPDNCSTSGQKVSTKMIIACNGGKAIFNITYDVTAQVSE